MELELGNSVCKTVRWACSGGAWKKKNGYITRQTLWILARGGLWMEGDAYLGGPICFAAQTIQFHIRNAFGCALNNRSTVTILRITPDKPTTLTLRPFAGDLFVLYEVLAFKAYYIASSLLRTDNVHVIVDCGANIGITSLFLAARYPTILSISLRELRSA